MRLRDMLAKSSPRESLTAHLAETLAGAAALRARIGRVALLEEATGGLFWDAVLLAGLCHDAGKIPDGFQAMLRGTVKTWGERHEVVSLGFLPGLIDDERLLEWVATGVATHHRALDGERGSLLSLYGGASDAQWRDRFRPVPGEVAAELAGWLAATAAAAGLPVRAAASSDRPVTMAGTSGWPVPEPSGAVGTPGHSYLRSGGTTAAGPSVAGEPDVIGVAWRLFDRLVERWEYPAEGDDGLAAVLLQGAVTLADHLSSAHGTLHARQPLDAGFRPLLERRFAAKGRRLRPHQVAAGAAAGHLLLRAPTGSGKTEAGLLWAARQVTDLAARTGGVPRVFFTLPYLASINAMADRLGDLLGDPGLVGVAHSRAASYHLATAICPEDGDDEHAAAARKAVSRAAATRLFRETIRVGTPYQLLRGVLAGPAHSGILIDAANSVFVLDELHAYDPRRLGYILAMAGLWERLGGRIAVLSATLPGALARLFRETLGQDVREVNADPAVAPLRHRLRLRDRHLTDPDTVAEIEARLASGEPVLVVANNVADAQTLFAALSPAVAEGSAFLLHSRFRRMDRAAVEEAIRDRFGVGRPRRPGLVVATQVVEVSLDVDFGCLFTSAAPLEALLQRFGRVNRVAARPPADVIVHAPAYRARRRGGGEHADGVYPRTPVELGWEILTRYDGQAVDEAQAGVWLDEVYDAEWGTEWCAEVRKHLAEFREAFLGFAHPFTGREELAERFDEMFDGTEAVLAEDRDAYEADLARVPGDKAAGRLLAERYLIPMPPWSTPLTRWEKRLGLRIVEADYSPELGLGQVYGPAAQHYEAGEVL